jgi:hypothetical protein
MEWKQFSEEKPKESDFYFVKGKGGRKAVMYYDDEWEIGSLAHNHFCDDEICWLDEK